jgi:hypothetical protein
VFEWLRYTGDNNVNPDLPPIYISPTISTSMRDIVYSASLPHKFVAIVSSICSTMKKHEIAMIHKLIPLLSILNRSIWHTSALAADMRFITLCYRAKTGKVNEMITEAFDKVVKLQAKELTLSINDFFMMEYMFKFAKRYNADVRDGGSDKLTPLF